MASKESYLNMLPTAIREPLRKLLNSGASITNAIVGNVTGNVTGDVTGVLSAAAKTMTTATVPASGSCAVQLTLKDGNGVTMAVPVSGLLYLSEVATGLTQDLADTTLAVLTNGALTNLGSAGPSIFTTTAAGLLGVTITAGTDSYWLVLVLPSGELLISDECVVNA